MLQGLGWPRSGNGVYIVVLMLLPSVLLGPSTSAHGQPLTSSSLAFASLLNPNLSARECNSLPLARIGGILCRNQGSQSHIKHRNGRQSTCPRMGLLDEDWKPTWYQKRPLRPPNDFALWLDLRGRPELGRGGKTDCSQQVEGMVRDLLKELSEAGPAIKECCPENPIQGLLFDERAYPDRRIGTLPHLVTRKDQAIVDEDENVVGRDITISSPPVQLAEAEPHFCESDWILIDGVLTGGREVLRPMLIEEMVAQCGVGLGSTDTRVMVSADNVLDANEAAMVFQYGKEWLRSIGGDREHLEEMLIKGFLSPEEWQRLDSDGLIPPLITPYLSRRDAQIGTWRREAAQQVLEQQEREGAAAREEEQRAAAAAERRRNAWAQPALLDLSSLNPPQPPNNTAQAPEAAGPEGEAEEGEGEERRCAGVHVLAVAGDAEVWAVAVALRARQRWVHSPHRQFSAAFPAGLPAAIEARARAAAHSASEIFERWLRTQA